jgi:hypothetical protein
MGMPMRYQHILPPDPNTFPGTRVRTAPLFFCSQLSFVVSLHSTPTWLTYFKTVRHIILSAVKNVGRIFASRND